MGFNFCYHCAKETGEPCRSNLCLSKQESSEEDEGSNFVLKMIEFIQNNHCMG